MSPTFLVATCPTCKVDCLDVQVGRKSTARTTTCRLCGQRFTYSAWVIKSEADRTFTKIELFPFEERGQR
jgi:transcription elongation factor Elf1